MNAILLLLIVIVLLLVYIILFTDGNVTPKNDRNTISQIPIRNEKQASVIGKTKTSFPSPETEGKPKEADKNRTEKPPTFAPESQNEDNDNEFNPMPPENEIYTDEIEREDLSILLNEEIEVSAESLTAKEIRRIQQAAERNSVSEQEKPALQKTVEKLQGSDFLEKLKSHEALQTKLNAELMQLIVGNREKPTPPEIKNGTTAEEWTSFL